LNSALGQSAQIAPAKAIRYWPSVSERSKKGEPMRALLSNY
jgi:hypothetical protein